VADQARHLATQARDPLPHYEHSEIGFNYRMSNLLAAIGRGQLTTLRDKIQRRRSIRSRYQETLGSYSGIDFMPEAPYGRSNAWLTCITVDSSLFGATSEQIRLHLESCDIEARRVWKPMHLQPVFRHCPSRRGRVSADLFNRGLCLPSGSSMSDADQWRVIAAIADAPRHLTGTPRRETMTERMTRV
jgi:dTDP-4-amino-4,6-dideoxygalactose transaminase